MSVIAVIAEKGGVGKTTLSLNIAVSGVLTGQQVAVLDLDGQATAAKWTDRREAEAPWVVTTPASRLDASIKAARAQGADLIVIDTPPHSGADGVEAARRADLVLIPLEPHIFSLETLPKLADLLKLAGNVPCSIIINKAPIQGSEAADAAEYCQSMGFQVCPHTLHLRAAHRHAENIGMTAQEYEPKGKAAEESQQVYLFACQLLNHGVSQHEKKSA
jgi:chromosome partitioning protein